MKVCNDNRWLYLWRSELGWNDMVIALGRSEGFVFQRSVLLHSVLECFCMFQLKTVILLVCQLSVRPSGMGYEKSPVGFSWCRNVLLEQIGCLSIDWHGLQYRRADNFSELGCLYYKWDGKAGYCSSGIPMARRHKIIVGELTTKFTTIPANLVRSSRARRLVTIGYWWVIL